MVQPYLAQDELKRLAEEHKSAELLESGFGDVMLSGCQEVAVNSPDIAFAMRPSIGVWEYMKICVDSLSVQPLSIPDYLAFKERLVGKCCRQLLIHTRHDRMSRPHLHGTSRSSDQWPSWQYLEGFHVRTYKPPCVCTL